MENMDNMENMVFHFGGDVSQNGGVYEVYEVYEVIAFFFDMVYEVMI